MAESVFKIDESGVDSLMNGTTGDVHKFLEEQGQQMVALARVYVGKKTGYLAARISYNVTRGGAGPILQVTADASYATMHHDGTKPHVIVPNTARVLRYKQGGRIVYAKRVFHPGTRPNPFLVKAMIEVVSK